MKKEQRNGIWIGIGLVLLCHAILIIAMLEMFPIYLLIGFVQVVYVVPISLLGLKNVGIAQGALIAGGVTLLLNSIACFGMFTGVFS